MGGKFKCFDNSANCSTAAKAKKKGNILSIFVSRKEIRSKLPCINYIRIWKQNVK